MTAPKALLLSLCVVSAAACINLPDIDDSVPEPPAPDGGPTDGGTDQTPPTLVRATPPQGSTRVPLDTTVELEFSEAMAESTLQLSSVPAAAFTLESWTPASKRAVFRPSSPLAQGQQYTLTAEGKDLAGNALAGNRSFTFDTLTPAPDTTPPTLLSSTPTYASSGAPRDTRIKLTFSESMNRASVERAFSFTSPAGTSIGNITWNSLGTEVEFTPRALFPYDTEVAWLLSPEAADLAGHAITESAGLFHTVRLLAFSLWRTAETGLASTEPVGTAVDWLIGDNTLNRPIHGFVTFNLQSLSSVTQVLSASLQWDYVDPGVSPFTSLGRFAVEPVVYETLSNDVFSTPSVGTPLLLGYQDLESPSGIANIPVTAMVVEAWAHRASRYERVQFRLKFESWTDNDNSNDAIQLNYNRIYLKLTCEGP